MKWESVVGLIFVVLITALIGRLVWGVLGFLLSNVIVLGLGFAGGWYVRGKNRNSVR